MKKDTRSDLKRNEPEISWMEHDLLNIQTDHIPISLHISGSFDGNIRLNERAPPNNIEA